MSTAELEPRTEFRLSSLILSVYIPTFLFTVGQGAVLPVTPLLAKDLGATVAVAALLVGMRSLGTAFADVPSGIVVSRLGEKHAMVIGSAIVGLVAIGVSQSSSVVVMGVLMFLLGAGWSFWQLARLAYVAEVVPVAHRGRAISIGSGANRLGTFAGPLIGTFVAEHSGLATAFYVQALMGFLACACMYAFVRDTGGYTGRHHARGALLTTLSRHKNVYLTAGTAIVVTNILRQARILFVPLWGDEIGLSVSQIGVAFSAAAVLDTMLTYPMGMIVDKWGRKWASVPAMLVLAASVGFLTLSETYGVFMALALLSGVGHGLSTGMVQLLGADFAPREGRGEFLGVWRLVADCGNAGGPVLISFLVGLAGLAAAAATVGGIGVAGAGLMAFFVRETLSRSRD
jgi:MFS family permease